MEPPTSVTLQGAEATLFKILQGAEATLFKTLNLFQGLSFLGVINCTIPGRSSTPWEDMGAFPYGRTPHIFSW
jgi:hypothetical protein